jgi:acyl-CoA dehydrogenase
MDFAPSPRAEELRRELAEFIELYVDPATPVAKKQVEESGDPHFHPPVMEDLKKEAARGLEPLHAQREVRRRAQQPRLRAAVRAHGTLAAVAGSHQLQRPDTGNMEVLRSSARLQVEEFLQPLLDGEIRSCFAMTEPFVASSDATNIQSRIERDGDDYVVKRTSGSPVGAASKRCTFAILMWRIRSQR